MTYPDELSRRAYLAEADRHHQETRQALELVIQHATTASMSLNREVNTAALRNVAQYAAEAVGRPRLVDTHAEGALAERVAVVGDFDHVAGLDGAAG